MPVLFLHNSPVVEKLITFSTTGENVSIFDGKIQKGYKGSCFTGNFFL